MQRYERNFNFSYRKKKKITREKIQNFIVKIQSEYRGNHTVEILFYFISISQSVAEIQGFKVDA